MKRLLVVLMLLVASPALGKVAIFTDLPAAAVDASAPAFNLAIRDYVCRVLDRTGADYVVVPKGASRTEFLRTGAVTWGFGTAGAYAETFDACIVVGFVGNAGRTSMFPSSFRPDSVTVFSQLPTVPLLYILGDQTSSQSPTIYNNAAADSTWLAGYFAGGEGSGNHEGEGTNYITNGVERFMGVAFVGRGRLKSGTPNGGIRVLAQNGANSSLISEFNGIISTVPDSVGIVSGSSADSVSVWELTHSHKTGAKPIVFAACYGGISLDSLGSDTPNPSIDVPLLMCGLARLDTLSDGKVFGKTQIKTGIMFAGGFQRRSSRDPYGFVTTDSSSIKTRIDSLAALNVRFTVGCRMDSVASYGYEVGWWQRATLCKFAPTNGTKVDTTKYGANANARWNLPLDAFGQYRQRRAYGGESVNVGTSADTTIYALWRSLFWHADSVFGAPCVDHIADVPDGDWSPLNLNSVTLDSTVYAFHKAGGKAILVNSQEPTLGTSALAANPRGYLTDQSMIRDRLGAGSVAILGYSGASLFGSTRFIGVSSDTSIPIDNPTGGINPACYAAHRIWNSLFQKRGFRDLGMMGTYTAGASIGVTDDARDGIYGIAGGNIMRLGVQTLSVGPTTHDGLPGIVQPNGSGMGWGYLAVKHYVHAIRAINRFAGRAIISIEYPGDVTP